MLELGQTAAGGGEPFLRGQPELFKVVVLAGIGDDDHTVGREVFDAVSHGGEVGRGVVASTVAFADDEGLLGKTRVLGVEDDKRAGALDGQAGGGEFEVNLIHLVAIKALAEKVIVAHVETRVNRLEGVEAELVDLLPKGDGGGFAVLEMDELEARPFEGRWGFAAGGVGGFVEAFEFFERVAGEGGLVEEVAVAVKDFAELRAPIAEVVVADDDSAAKGEEAANGLADHDRADVADVHLLRGVGRAVVHDVAAARVERGGAGAEVGRGGVGGEPPVERSGLEAEVDETGAGDLGVVGGAGGRGEGGDELLGELARIEATGLGVTERAVGLEIAVAGIGGADFGREA